MGNALDASKLAALAAALPGRLQAAAQAFLDAERRLAHVLLRRETGEPLKTSEIGVARMALARTQRDLEDLKKLQDALPELLERPIDSRQGTQTVLRILK